MIARFNGLIEASALALGAPPRLARELAWFCVVGLGSTLAYSATIAALVSRCGVSPMPATAAGFFMGTGFSYVFNSMLSFRAALTAARLRRFFLVTAAGFVLNMGLMGLVVDVWRLWYGLGIIATTLVVPLFNFAGHKVYTYRAASLEG